MMAGGNVVSIHLGISLRSQIAEISGTAEFQSSLKAEHSESLSGLHTAKSGERECLLLELTKSLQLLHSFP